LIESLKNGLQSGKDLVQVATLTSIKLLRKTFSSQEQILFVQDILT
jgi:hypothetical protein